MASSRSVGCEEEFACVLCLIRARACPTKCHHSECPDRRRPVLFPRRKRMLGSTDVARAIPAWSFELNGRNTA